MSMQLQDLPLESEVMIVDDAPEVFRRRHPVTFIASPEQGF